MYRDMMNAEFGKDMSKATAIRLLRDQMLLRFKKPYAGKVKISPEEQQAVRERNTMRLAYTVQKLRLRLALAAIDWDAHVSRWHAQCPTCPRALPS